MLNPMSRPPFHSIAIALTLAGILSAPVVQAQDATPKRSAKVEGGEPKYIDGKKVSELPQPGTLAPGKPTIGSIDACNGRHEPFNGGIDDMRVYTGALTEAQVAALVAGKAETVPEAIVGHWKLDGNLDNEADKKAAATRLFQTKPGDEPSLMLQIFLC